MKRTTFHPMDASIIDPPHSTVATPLRFRRQKCSARLQTALFLFALMLLLLPSGFAQTGLPLNFSPLANPLADPQSYYLESDTSIPLGDKTPLILVHGIDVFSGPPSDSASGWDNFCTWFYNTPSLSSRYKLYRFAFQSNQSSVQTLGDYLRQLLDANDGSATDQQLHGKDVVILAHSMGGLAAATSHTSLSTPVINIRDRTNTEFSTPEGFLSLLCNSVRLRIGGD